MKPLAGLLRIALHLLILRPFVRVFSGIDVLGRENLRSLDRFIVVANHNSHYDTLLLFCLLPIRQLSITHPVADQTYFSRSRLVFRLVSLVFQPIWIERGEATRENDPLVEIEKVIGRGHNVILYPEGTRGAPGEMLPFRSGIGRLAVRYPTLPIVPVYLSGPERVLPKKSGLPLPFCSHVVVGPPQRSHGSHRDVTRALEEMLRDLARSEEARRHRRGEHPSSAPPTVAVIGIDGSGKSTLAQALALRLSTNRSVCVVSDELHVIEGGAPKSLQPLLTETVRRLIGKYAKRAKSLKGYKVPKLVELLLRDHLLHQVQRFYRPDLIVMDGSPLLNLVAWAVLYREELFNETTCSKALALLSASGASLAKDDPLYRDFPELRYLERLRRLHLPDAALYLDVPPSSAIRRIESRGAARQAHETEEKLTKLSMAYRMVLNVAQQDCGLRAATLHASATPDAVTDEAVEQVQRWLSPRTPS
ncbi:MAG: 1-acyl-sn-glycerol-3-phosphate acyltransferase [Planctomycetota bacterium]